MAFEGYRPLLDEAAKLLGGSDWVMLSDDHGAQGGILGLHTASEGMYLIESGARDLTCTYGSGGSE